MHYTSIADISFVFTVWPEILAGIIFGKVLILANLMLAEQRDAKINNIGT